jgi:hypothetical protein
MKPTLVSLLGQVFPQAHGGSGVAYEVEAFGGGVLWHFGDLWVNSIFGATDVNFVVCLGFDLGCVLGKHGVHKLSDARVDE